MNRLRLSVPLLAGVALVAWAHVPPASADSARITIRTANVRALQPDLNGVPAPVLAPAPVPTSPTPLPSPRIGDDGLPVRPAPLPASPTPLHAQPPASPVSPGLPPAPVPDPQLSPQPGGAMHPGGGVMPPRGGVPHPGGGPLYKGPWGSDYQRPPAPPKQYLGDLHGPAPMPIPQHPLPFDPGMPAHSGIPAPLQDPILSQPLMGLDRYGMSPPPGTLGQTYRRRSRLIDDDKHPRIGMVEVHLSENYDVSAEGLKSKWTGKVWRLESDPLLPGIPHIYDVKAEWGPEGAKNVQTRTIRLIMGRIVDLEF